MGNLFADLVEADQPNLFADLVGVQAAAAPPTFSSGADQESFFSRLMSSLSEFATRTGGEISQGAAAVAETPLDFTNPENLSGILSGIGGALQAFPPFAAATVGGHMGGEKTLAETGSPAAATAVDLIGQIAGFSLGNRAIGKGAKAIGSTLDSVGYRYPRAAGPTPPIATEIGKAANPAVDDVLKSTPSSIDLMSIEILPTEPALPLGRALPESIRQGMLPRQPSGRELPEYIRRQMSADVQQAALGEAAVKSADPQKLAQVVQAATVQRAEAIGGRAQNIRDRFYQSVTETRERLTPQWFGKLLHENYGLPRAFVEAKRAEMAAVSSGMDEAQAALTDLTQNVPFTMRKSVTGFMVGSLDEAGLRRVAGVTDEMIDRVKGIRGMIDRNSAEFLELSIPEETKQTIGANLGKYVQRVYRQYATPDFRPAEDVIERARSYLLANGTTPSGSALGDLRVTKILDSIMQGGATDPFSVGRTNPVRLNSGLLKRRKNIPQELQDLMGVFEEAGVPEAKTLASQGAFIEKHKFFQGVATTPDWTLPDALVTRLKTDNPALLGTKEVVYNGIKYKQMSDTAGLGALKGRYVQEFIADDLTSMEQQLGWWQKNVQKAVSEFKIHKVVLSAKTHFRNLIGNGVLLNISGVNGLKMPLLLGRAMNEMRVGEVLYQRMIRGEDVAALMNGPGGKYVAAKQAGLFGSTFSTNEINAIAAQWDTLDKATKAGPFVGQLWKAYDGLKRTAGNIYQAEEAWFKTAKVLDEMDKGAALADAASEARKVLYDYSEVSKAVGAMRRGVVLGSPFITFTAKTIPRVAEAAIRHPVAFWKYPVIFGAMGAYAADKLGFDEKGYANFLKQMPDYVRKGAFLLLPTRDRKGNPQFLDFTYLLPWGNLSDIVTNLTGASREPTQAIKQFLGPGGNIFAAFAPALTGQDPKDPFTGRTVYRRGDTGAAKLQKGISYAGRALLSPMVPGIPGIFEGGYDFQRVSDAIRGVAQGPDKEPMSVPAALSASLLGLKTSPINPAQARKNLAFQYRQDTEAQKEVIYAARRQGDTATAKEHLEILRNLAKEYRARSAQVKQDETNQFKNFYRDFQRSFGAGTGP